MLIVVRHGSTKMNGNGGEGERMRGWLKLPLSSDGRDEVERTAKKLKGLNLKGTIDSAFTSDLPRAVETAKTIEPAVGTKITPTNKLRDWNIGDYTGKSVEDNLDDIHSYMKNPDSQVPGGESFDDFTSRTVPFIKGLVEDEGTHLAVTHNRITTLISALAKNKGDSPDERTLMSKGPVDPAGIMFVDSDWNILNKINV